MTDQQHPITPPPQLVQQWLREWTGTAYRPNELYVHIATAAAQWGADQELEACCQHVQKDVTEFTSHAHLCAQRKSDGLRAARRPKPPSLKEQALEALDMHFAAIGEGRCYQAAHKDTIRRALEALPND
jgi:hypothetical protein